MRIYFDSAIVIYIIEQSMPHSASVSRFLQAVSVREYVCTELSRAECLVGPRRSGNRILEIEFEWFFRQSFVRMQSFSRQVFDRAIDLRTKYRSLKTPDALHLACAIEAHCDYFLTNDVRLAAVTEIAIHQI